MTKEELLAHQRRMLKFCHDRNLAIDDIVVRIEGYINTGRYDQRGSNQHQSRTAVVKCVRLLIEALDAIKKLTGHI
jgi:hypothetical protein